MCWLCHQPIDLATRHRPGCTRPHCCGCHPHRSTVDEIIPRSQGGSSIDRANCRHAHARCNESRGAGTPVRNTTETHWLV